MWQSSPAATSSRKCWKNSASDKTLQASAATANNHSYETSDMRLQLAFLGTTMLAVSSFGFAQAQRPTLVREESIRVSPSTDAAKLGEAGRGHELVIIESGHDWTHVEAILREPRKDADEDDPESEGKAITGWVSSKALVSLTTPNGDKIVFGEAADSEDQANPRWGPHKRPVQRAPPHGGQDCFRRSRRLRRPSQSPPRPPRCRARRHAPLLPGLRFVSDVPTRRRSTLPRRRHPLADGSI